MSQLLAVVGAAAQLERARAKTKFCLPNNADTGFVSMCMLPCLHIHMALNQQARGHVSTWSCKNVYVTVVSHRRA
jgi:hypothetical protein